MLCARGLYLFTAPSISPIRRSEISPEKITRRAFFLLIESTVISWPIESLPARLARPSIERYFLFCIPDFFFHFIVNAVVNLNGKGALEGFFLSSFLQAFGIFADICASARFFPRQVKADLAQRLKDGEDIVQIMKDTEKELRTLATFRNDMMKELTALRFDESVTEQDYKDFVEAANRMLKERGLKELSSPAFAEAQLKYIREVHKAKQAAKAAREASNQQAN